jgi:hypothetical protein
LNKEKFINYYISLLNSTISEAINKNLVIQAEKKVLEDDLLELKKLEDLIVSMRTEHQNQINDLKNQLNEARKQKEVSSIENNELKKSVQHVDTFKNELSIERTKNKNLIKELDEKSIEIENLKKQIEKLNSKNDSKSIVRNSKKDKQQLISEFIFQENDESLNTVKDAGKF